MPVPATSVRFADAARRLASACRAQNLIVPGFRSPPALPAADRTIRRRADGAVIVAVRVKGRPLASVMADLVEGVIVANGLSGPEAEATRGQLLGLLEPLASAEPARAA